MKTSLVFAFLMFFLAYGCRQESPEDDQLSSRIQALESKVDSLEQRLADHTLNSPISSSLLFRSPLEQFFQSPEFWENTYDVGEVECSKRCIEALTTHRQQCEQITDENERLQCYQEASDRAANCHRQCANI